MCGGGGVCRMTYSDELLLAQPVVIVLIEYVKHHIHQHLVECYTWQELLSEVKAYNTKFKLHINSNYT